MSSIEGTHDAATRTEGLTKVYGHNDSEVRALAGVTVSIERGDFTAVMGPSGSGKSEYARAFLRAVVATGLDQPGGLTSYSWPDRVSYAVSTWPPLDLECRTSF